MIQKYGLYIIWVISCLGTLGSLYIEEPSYLDWYQRICLFPFVFIAGIAAWRGFLSIAPYFIPQSLIGLGCSFYQILLLKKPAWFSSFYSEQVSSLLCSFVFAGIFFSILVFSILLSKKQSSQIVL
ncbi:MAG TPA: hypothetical protein DCE71_05105 [Parachlamydiales bacterium]|nr:hypothetical protein [Parachlamydiales bacterium]